MQRLWNEIIYCFLFFFFFFFFLKSNFKVCTVIRQVNDLLLEKCKEHRFGYVSNDKITAKFLWKDGVHLRNDRTFVFASNVVNVIKILF